MDRIIYHGLLWDFGIYKESYPQINRQSFRFYYFQVYNLTAIQVNKCVVYANGKS